jgi:methanethiol S-methyltransferase
VKYIILSAIWIAFCVLHSALISITFTDFLKRKSNVIYRYHRLAFNIISIMTLIPVLVYSLYVREKYFFTWDGYLLPVKYFIFFVGISLFIAGAKHYNASAFFGFSRIKNNQDSNLINKSGMLDKSGILGIIRHPFYAGVLLVIWAGNIDVTNLIINCILTAYIIIGTYLEERKLLLEFGNTYIEYQREVSMLFPLKFIIKHFLETCNFLKKTDKKVI